MKIISVVGARPNFVKIAPFCTELRRVKDKIEHLLVHTGQHYDHSMSREFFTSLGIPDPDIHMNIGSASHAVQTAGIMVEFEKLCADHRPDWVVVVGDVNSTMACAIAAKKMNIKVAHIEAGLRSFDMTMPEEINRKLTDAISDILFTPSSDAGDNLVKEGVPRSRIKMVGNIMIDTLAQNMEKIDACGYYRTLGLEASNYVFSTLHRPSNVDDRATLEKILKELSLHSKRLPVVFSVHPRTRKMIESYGLRSIIERADGFKILDPVSYHQSLNLIKHARLVLTDSGGMQEESTFLGVPCLTLRPNTERPVTIREGTNKLTDPTRLRKDIEKAISKRAAKKRKKPPKFWDGKTAARIVDFFIKTEWEKKATG